MSAKTLQINRTQCVRILSFAIIAVVFFYVYMVNAISFDAASKERLGNLISIRQSEISDLESRFLSESKKICRETAKDFNLVKSVENDTIVVVRESNTRLTFNE